MQKTTTNKQTQKTPLVSVLLTAYKESLDFFSEALESILNQTYRNLEIITIIDNPQDVYLSGYAQKKAIDDKRIRIIKNDKNLGLALSLNKAIKLANGNYICRMDADDISLTNRIEKQLEYLMKHDLDLIGGYVSTINHSGRLLYNVTNIPTEPRKIAVALKWNNTVPHPTWFGTKSIFRQLYRDIPLCEDYDFLLRSIANKFTIGNLPEIILKYRMSTDSISRSNLYSQYLSQCFLTKQYKRNQKAALKDLEKYKNSHFNKNKAVRYEKANKLFNSAVKLLNSKQLIGGVAKILTVPIISLSYSNKIRRLLLASLLSHGNSKR